MYLLCIKSKFDAAHFLGGYSGPCANMHGHTWKVEALFSTESLDRLGLAVDFKVLKRELGKITGRFDHSVINSVLQKSLEDTENNPTAENLAKYIYDALKKSIAELPIQLAMITVWESDDAWAAYSES